ncbi:hypothetical protein K7432_009777 [Basidiobolus ranarum]|uniref:Cyclin N-terminal domain-containing protein n=1 Tax=Basidiobolus ranarum TaxID=34480 RepID=A0ABR2VWJ5_9FUNG
MSQTWLSAKYPLLPQFSKNNIPLLANFVAHMVHQMWHQKANVKVGIPSITFRDFCKGVILRSEASPSVIFLGLKYVQRLTKHCPDIRGEEGSECRLFVISLIISHKMLEDSTFTNQTWSELTLIPVEELNQMEAEFLHSIKYRLHMPEEEFSQWLLYIEQFIRHQEISYLNIVDLPFLNSQRLICCDIKKTPTHNHRSYSNVYSACYSVLGSELFSLSQQGV